MARRAVAEPEAPALAPAPRRRPDKFKVPSKRARRREQTVLNSRSVAQRRYHQTVKSIDLWTVLKVSVCFYLCTLVVVLTAGIVLWSIASAAGVIGHVESFIGDLLGTKDFTFLSWRILRGATLIGLVLVCLSVVLTVVAAAFYNLFAELVGGIEVTIIEEEQA